MALTLVVGLFAVQAVARNQQVIVTSPEAQALQQIAIELRALRTQGVPLQLKANETLRVRVDAPVEVAPRAGSEFRVRQSQ